MSKLTIAILAAGAVAAAGYITSKVIKDKKKNNAVDDFDEDYCGECCTDCSEEDLDVVIPSEKAEEAEEAAETAEEAVDEAAEKAEDAAEDVSDSAEEAAE